MFMRYIVSVFLLFSTYALAATCASPTDTIAIGTDLNNQEIDSPFIDGDASSGEALYYEINLVADGTLTLSTDKDGEDTVDTYGYLRDASCSIIETATVFNTDPRRVSLSKILSAGTYYFQVENNVSTADAVAKTAHGFFKINSAIVDTHPPREIFISKIAPIVVDSGKALTYQINLTNTGTEDTTSVLVADAITIDFSYQSFSSSADWNCTQSGLDVSCDLLSGVISANGGTKTLFITVAADYVAVDTLVTSNTATADMTYVSGSLSVSDNHDITINKAIPSMALSKTAVSSGTTTAISRILQNAEFDYILKVTNDSQMIENNVVMIDDVPVDFTVKNIDYDAAVWDCNSSSLQHVECALLSDLAPLAWAEFRINVQATGAINTGIINPAFVDASTPLGSKTASATASASMNIEGEVYTSTFSKTNPDMTIVVGDSTTYTIAVINPSSSNSALSGINIIDVLPPELNASSVISAGWTCLPIVSNTIDCTFDSNLSVGASTSIDVVATALLAGASVDNTAILKSIELPDKNASKSITILATASSALTIAKTSSQDVVIEDDIFSYIISVTNSGAGSESNLLVEDDIPSEFTVDANIISGAWSCGLSENMVSCALASLPAGATADDINITVKAPSNIPSDKNVTNTATLTSDKETTGKTVQKDVSFISPDTAISVHMKSNPDTVYQGEKFILDLFISNNSGKTTETAEVSSILPAGVVFDYADSGGWLCDYNTTTREIACNTNGTKLLSGDKQISLHVFAPNYEVNVTTVVSVTTDLDPYVRDGNVTTVVLSKKSELIFTQSDTSKDPVDVNETFTYAIKIQNIDTGSVINDVAAKNITVAIALDPNLSYVDDNASGWDCNLSGVNLTCILQSDLAVGAESLPIYVDVFSPVTALTITALDLTSELMKVPVVTSIAVDVYEVVNANLALTLSGENDMVEAAKEFSYIFDVANSGTSEDAKEVVVKVETLSSDNFTLNSFTGLGWNCSQSDIVVYCHLDILTANSTSTLALNVTAPDINSTLKINATLYSNVVSEVDLSDNSISKTTQIVKYDFMVDNLRDFSQVMINGNANTNIYGEVFTIGNQSMCEKDGSGCQEPSSFVNDWVYQEEINLDPLAMAYSSATSATLDILDTDEVVWAGLYWMGMIDKNEGDGAKIDEANHVYLRHKDDASYEKVQSSILKFNWKNDTSFGVDIFGYQGVAEVTDYIKTYKKGEYWVADVQTTEGYNLSAGWSLVVVVQDKTMTRKLRNITLFDGFQSVWKNTAYIEANAYPDEITATVNGFLTPNSGTVDSKLSLFGVEGDKTLKDSISVSDLGSSPHLLTNVVSASDDVVNGTISDAGTINYNRTPHLENTSGIDIDTFDISTIIENGQSSTDIKISSEGDRFYLGMFSFSTELYEPDMCYVQTMTESDYSPLLTREMPIGAGIGFEGYIENRENEVARNMTFKIEVDPFFQDTYTDDNETLELQNINASGILEATYASNLDLWEGAEHNITDIYGEDRNQTTFTARIGRGASAAHGGDIGPSDKMHFRYNGVIDGFFDNNLTQNIYKISYQVDNMPDVLETTIRRCQDFNESLSVQRMKTKGFNVVHEGGLPAGTIDSDNISVNHLYTQLSDTDFNVDIVGLDVDLIAGRVHKGVVRVDIIDVNESLEEYMLRTGEVEETAVGNLCRQYPIRATQSVVFNNQSRETILSNIPTADRRLGYRVQYMVDFTGRYAQWDGLSTLADYQNMLVKAWGVDNSCKTACSATSTVEECQACIFNPLKFNGSEHINEASCARDQFSVRPHTIMIDTNGTTLVGGRDYNLTINANANYSQDFISAHPDKSIKRYLAKPAGCMIADDNAFLGTTFVDGNASVVPFAYNNVGDINVALHDGEWVSVDKNFTDTMMSDCEVNSTSNIRNINGKFGCDLESTESFSFVASHFTNDISLRNDDNSSFTYLDVSGKRGARAHLTIKALLDDSSVATNYTEGCYAKDINYTFSAVIPTAPIKYGQFYEHSNTLELNATQNKFQTAEGNFSAGVTKSVVGINFARSVTSAENPFKLFSNVIDINVTDGDTNGTGVNLHDGNATYYYARLYAPDYLSIESSNFKAALFYEVYCDEDAGCDKTVFNLSTLSESRDNVNWYIFNPNHHWKFGDYNAGSVVSVGDLSVDTNIEPFSLDLNLSATTRRPYCDSVSLEPDVWFKYDEHSGPQAEKLSFKACFISTGSWAGTGEVGMAVDGNISREKNTKIDW